MTAVAAGEATLYAQFSSPHLVVIELGTAGTEDFCEILRLKGLGELHIPVVVISNQESPRNISYLKNYLEALDAYICNSAIAVDELLVERAVELLQVCRDTKTSV